MIQGNAAGDDCTGTAVWTSSNEALIKPTGKLAGEFLVTGVGDGNISATCANVVGRTTVHVSEPTSWPVSGRVVQAPGGAAIAGATLSLLGATPVLSDASGGYTLATSRETVPLLVSAPGFRTRETSLRGGELRELDIDLIGSEPAFPLKLYREMVWNAYEQPPGIPLPALRRWTVNPNVYLWTRWRNTPDKTVGNIQWFVDEIRRIIPILTAGTLQAGTVEYGPEQRPLTPGWITVTFDSSLQASGTPIAENPGRMTLNFDDPCRYYVLMHEFGHAMGLWHSSAIPSLMGNAPRFCTPFALSRDEELVIRTMYSRPPGNVEPDRDPGSAFLLR